MSANGTSFTSARSQLAEHGCELYAQEEAFFESAIAYHSSAANYHYRQVLTLKAKRDESLRKCRKINADVDIPSMTGRRVRVIA